MLHVEAESAARTSTEKEQVVLLPKSCNNRVGLITGSFKHVYHDPINTVFFFSYFRYQRMLRDHKVYNLQSLTTKVQAPKAVLAILVVVVSQAPPEMVGFLCNMFSLSKFRKNVSGTTKYVSSLCALYSFMLQLSQHRL